MHIPDGLLPPEVCVLGYAATVVGTGYSLYRINRQEDPEAGIPKASLLTAAFFVASWIHIPVPPTSVHLVLNGILGMILGYYAFPAILIGLFFQAVMFQHGGLTTLGVNTAMMAFPAMAAYWVFQIVRRRWDHRRGLVGGAAFTCGFLGIALAVVIQVAVLLPTIPDYMDKGAEQAAILTMAAAHIPVMFIEGGMAALLVLFLRRVKPEILENDFGPKAREKPSNVTSA
jgi:cobalt/nickel transport system permease protein